MDPVEHGFFDRLTPIAYVFLALGAGALGHLVAMLHIWLYDAGFFR